jgi:hypothetical protein
MDWLLTVIYAGYMIFQVHLVRLLYGSLKKTMGPVAKQANCHLFLIKMIIFKEIVKIHIIDLNIFASENKISGNFWY